MELYDLASPVEHYLASKADLMRVPLGGSMELLPLCNMDCKMCYIRLSKAQMEEQGRLLTVEEWLQIAEDAKKNGVLFLLITGGEPLLYPKFDVLYTKLTQMGFVITINTNGTLLNEKWANLFAERPCRRLNITLYGADDETYGKLCGNPKGFSQVMKAVDLLNERQIPFRFNCSVTPDNVEQLSQLYEIARKKNAPLEACSYMFPPARKGDCSEQYIRLTPERAAKSLLDSFQAKNPEFGLDIAIKNTLAKIKPVNCTQITEESLKGLNCRAGRSGFWITWKGELLPCGMFDKPKISLLNHTFEECWNYIVTETSKLSRCKECECCDKKEICKTCAASCLTESGRVDGKPEYLCEMTQACYRMMMEYEV